MTTRRASLRSSVFVILALVATRVPACEYGQEGTTVVAVTPPPAAPDLPAATAPIVSNLPTLLV
jgi:hypothetical protein